MNAWANTDHISSDLPIMHLLHLPNHLENFCQNIKGIIAEFDLLTQRQLGVSFCKDKIKAGYKWGTKFKDLDHLVSKVFSIKMRLYKMQAETWTWNQ